MARRRRADKREVLPDTKYKSEDLNRFINYVMFSGKKTTAERIVYQALEQAEQEMHRPGIEIFDQAI